MALQHIQPQLLDWLDDICVRFIINLPKEEFQSVERIIFQIEEGHWYYEDFIRPLDPTLPSLTLRTFCSLIFQHCPLLSGFSEYHAAAYAEFLAYKTRIPVRGAILLNESMDQAVLVKGWKKGSSWGFPRGKINKDEKDLDCAIREVYEETGYEVREAGLVRDEDHVKFIDVTLREQQIRLYVFRGVPIDTNFEPRTRKEISKIQWYKVSDLPGGRQAQHAFEGPKNLFYMVAPFIAPLRAWIKLQRKLDRQKGVPAGLAAPDDAGTDLEATHDELIAADAPEVAERSQADTNHLQFLLSRLNQSKSEQSQEVPTMNQSHANQLALGLKKMLSVGSAPASATVAPPAATQLHVSPQPSSVAGGSLMSLLRPNSTALPPLTPADHMDISPPQPQTHHHDRKSIQNMPPPHFLHPGHEFPQHRFSFANTSNVYPQPPLATPQFQQPPMPHQHQMPPRQTGHVQHVPPQMRTPSMPFTAQHHAQPGTNGPHPTAFPPGFGGGAPQAAAAPAMPPAKLNPHSLALLNTFKASAISTEPVPVSPETKSLELPNDNVKNFERKGSLSARQIISAGFIPNAEPANAQLPRNHNPQQSALLGLFRNGQSMAPSVPASEVPVAELSAGTPKTVGKVSQAAGNEQRQAAGAMPRQSHLTSATVSGPLNAPDFGAVQRARPPVELGGGPENSHTPVPVHAIAAGMVLEAPRPFHPSMILQRQQQYTPTDAAAQGPAKAQASLPGVRSGGRGVPTTEQKTALLSLFNVKAPPAAGKSAVQGPQRRASGNGSPVSPLPDGRVPVKQAEVGQVGVARSRVGSLADDGRAGEAPITPVDKKFLFKYLEDMVNGS